MSEQGYPGWTRAAVGLHWMRGDYTASTVQTGDGKRSGYAVWRNGKLLASYVEWAEVERIADRRDNTHRDLIIATVDDALNTVLEWINDPSTDVTRDDVTGKVRQALGYLARLK